MTKSLEPTSNGRKNIRTEDLAAVEGFPVDKFQPNSLPKLKKGGKLPDNVILALQGPACMLDF